MEKIVIIGAGPAGISAALYAARANKNPLVLDNGIGALEKAERIENYYGFPDFPSGKELYERGLEQARALGVRIRKTQVLGIGGFDTFEIHVTEGNIEAESVILATGAKRKSLPLPGLRELEGRGVSYCAVCDAFFYRGKTAAVLGNGDFALHEASELENLCAKVIILTNGLDTEFSRKCTFPVDTRKILRIEGIDSVDRVVFEDGETMDMDGVFVALGTAGSAEIARQMGAELTDKGHVAVDDAMQTTIPGLFAAGDCTGGLLQVAKAVYEGSLAGINAGKYVKNRNR